MKEFIDRDAHIPPSEQLIYTGLSTGPRRGLEVIYDGGVNSIYCSITVNHRLTGPGKMVKLCLLFVGKFQIQKFD